MNSEKYQVLILDDDIALGEMLREFLQNTQQCDVVYINHIDDFWDRVRGGDFDIIFLDYRMPETNGLEVLAAMADRGIKVPTVMMTGEGSENVAARAIQSGAFDYLVKGQYSFSTLPALIQKAVRQREMQNAMQHYLDQIRYQATLLDNMRDAVVVWDLNGKITYWNTAAEQLYGVAAAECLGKSVSDVYFPYFDPPIHFPDHFHNTSYQLEHRFKHPDGATLWISTQITSLTNEHSQTIDQEGPPMLGFMDVARDVTPRKQEHEALLQSRHFIQRILDTSPNIIYILDLSTRRMRYINPEVSSILGYGVEVFINKPFEIFEAYLHPEDRSGLETHLQSLAQLKEGQVAEIEYRFMNSRKEWRWINSRATIFSRSESQQPLEIIGVLQDITSSKQAEEKLQHRFNTEKLLSAISKQFLNVTGPETDPVLHEALLLVGNFIRMDYALVMVLEDDRLVPYHLAQVPSGRYPSQKLTETGLAGLKLTWLLGRLKRHETVLLNSIADLPPQARDEQDLLERMGSGPATFIPMIYNNRMYGMLGFGSSHPGFARGEDQLDMLHSFSEMVTNALVQKQVDQALRKSEARYRAIVEDHQTEMICRFLPDCTLTFVNEAYCRYYHKDRSQLIGTSFLASLPAGEREQVCSLLANLSTNQPVNAFEQRVQLDNGQMRWQEWTGRAIFDQHNDFIEFQAIGRDITERKRIEQQLKTAQTHLTQSVRLASIGELASGVAHQISNPLTTIIADAQILLHQLDQHHPGRESADAIVKAGWRAQEVINELMKFSQPAQKMHEQVSINDTIEKALLLASAHIQANGIKLNIEIAPDLPEITANPRQLTDLWVNLLLLARSATEDGGRHTIRIRTRRIKENLVVVDVTDDGRPIPREQFETIFEPQMIPTGAGRGTGMELSLCREIVRQNQGKIAISGNGVETTFRVTFSTEGPL